MTRGNYSNGTRDEDLYRIVANGIPGTAMNGFGGELGDDNVWRVVSYLRTIAPHAGDLQVIVSRQPDVYTRDGAQGRVVEYYASVGVDP